MTSLPPAGYRHGVGTEATRARRCLVVDDQPETRAELARMPGADPSVARVGTAEDAPGALRVLRDADVDVAFIEACLPAMDGVDLAWVLNKLRATPAVMFVTRDPGRAADAIAARMRNPDRTRSYASDGGQPHAPGKKMAPAGAGAIFGSQASR
jgi:chemotaxis response regulator CheB